MGETAEVLVIIIARTGSEGLPNKNFLTLLGKPVLAYTIEDALAAQTVDRIVLSTDWDGGDALAKQYGIDYLPRPAKLCRGDCMVIEVYRDVLCKIGGGRYVPDVVVTLYGNVPVRPLGGIDDAVGMLLATGGDSVQSIEDIGSRHPFWAQTYKDGRIRKFIDIQADTHNRQNLPPVYALNGAITVALYDNMMASGALDTAGAHLGTERYGLLTEPHDCIDIDCLADFYAAEGALRARQDRYPPLRDWHPLVGPPEKPHKEKPIWQNPAT